MGRKGGNNVSGRVFTSYERQLAQKSYGTQSTRLGAHSLTQLGQCAICQGDVEEPVVACGGAAGETEACGAVMCKECALSSLLAQKQDIAGRKKRIGEALKSSTLSASGAAEERPSKRARTASSASASSAFSDPNETRLQMESLEREKQERFKTGLSHWVPGGQQALSTTGPSAEHEAEELQHAVPLCPTQKHELKMKTWIPIHFTRSEGVLQCPLCSRSLANMSSVLALSRCGHVLCKVCVDSILQVPPSDAAESSSSSFSSASASPSCPVCNIPIVESKDSGSNTGASNSDSTKKRKRRKSKPAVVHLSTGGTAFAASGGESKIATKASPALRV